MKHFRLLGWLVVVLTATGFHFAPTGIRADTLPMADLEESDLLFRVGTETVSAAIRAVSFGRWSHVGLLTNEGGQWMVIHALPSESEGKVGGVIIEPLASFLEHAQSVSVFRNRLAEDKGTVSQRARTFLARPFGFASSETYCTKLVIDAYASSSAPITVSSQTFKVFGNSYEIVLPQALADSAVLQRIF